ncbi:NADH pyrophosphatase [Chlamydia trachomatis]|nr:NADH pyrophosphatase [Chlamydia trachomatis]
MTYKTQNYCTDCGHLLELKCLENVGNIPYCNDCQEFRFPIFNTACSMIVLDEVQENILLIQQYGRPDYILTAGYINQGEAAEQTVAREIMEELGLTTTSIRFNKSQYYPGSNTLMLNFVVTTSGPVQPNHEIDHWQWFSKSEAQVAIKPNSLAQEFLNYFLQQTS